MCQHYIRNPFSTKLATQVEHLETRGLGRFWEVCVISRVFPRAFGVVWSIWGITLGVLGSQGFKEHKQQQGKLFYLSFKLKLFPMYAR